MNLKTILIWLFSTLLPLSILGQSNDNLVQWGELFKFPGSSFKEFKILGAEENYYYLQLGKGQNRDVLKFDYNHKLISTRPLDVYLDDKLMDFTNVVKTKSGVYGLQSKRSLLREQWNIYAARLKDGRFEHPFKAYEHEIKIGLPSGGYAQNYRFNSSFENTSSFIVSEDKSKVALINNKNPSKVESIVIAVFDDQMNLLWEKHQEFPIKEKKFVIYQVIVSNEGEVFLAAYLSGWSKVYRITKHDLIEYPIQLESKYNAGAPGIIVKDTKAIFSGFCDYTSDLENKVRGVYFIKQDLNSDKQEVTVSQVDESFLASLEENRAKKNSKVWHYSLETANALSDGGYSFTATNKYIRSLVANPTLSTKPGYAPPTAYIHSSIIHYKLDETGNLQNIHNANRYMKYERIERPNLFTAFLDGKTYVYYFHTPDRKERKAWGLPWSVLVARLMIFDNSGAVESDEIIIDGKDANKLHSALIGDTNGTKLLFGGQILKKTGTWGDFSKNQMRFGVIELE